MKLAIHSEHQTDFEKMMYSPRLDEYLAEYFGTIRDGDIQVISIRGALHKYGYGSAYSLISTYIEQAINDDEVKSIVLSFSSVGGNLEGLFDCAEHIRKANEIKPIVAVVDSAFSAAGFLASACSKIYMSHETSEIGSYGVMCVAHDDTEYFKKLGIIRKMFTSKNAKKKNLSPFTEEGEKLTQESLDEAEAYFFKELSNYRNKPFEECLEDFGNGQTFFANEAIKRGMADEIANIETVINLLSQEQEDKGDTSMDIEKMSAEEQAKVFQALATSNPELINAIKTEAESKERERMAQLDTVLIKGCTEELVANAKAQGKTKAEIIDDVVVALQGQLDKQAQEFNALNEKYEALKSLDDRDSGNDNPNPPQANGGQEEKPYLQAGKSLNEKLAKE